MPTVNLDKKRFLKYLDRDYDDEFLKERIAMLGTDLDSITETEIIVEAFPNRPDLLGEAGMARALRGFIGIETGLPAYDIKKGNWKVSVDHKVKKIREHAVCAVAKNVNIDSAYLKSLMQIKKKLHVTHSRNRKMASIGMYDLDTVKFPIKYTTVQHDFKFTPLEATKEMTVKQILKEHPKGKDYAHLLVGDEYPMWIDAQGQVLSMPPIINSAETAITEKTKNLFIDVTGLDGKVVDQAMSNIVALLHDHGAKIEQVNINGAITPNMAPWEMKFDYKYINKFLGLDLTDKEIKKHLERMRIGVRGDMAVVPAYRTDILHPRDLMEEVAISYGYENFEAEIPNVSTVGEEQPATVFQRKLAEACVGLGLLECLSFHLSNEGVLIEKMDREPRPLLKVTNPVNKDYDTIRDLLMPGLLKVLSENKHHELPQKLFEQGTVVDEKMNEVTSLAIVSSHANAGYDEARSMVEAIFRSLGKPVAFTQDTKPYFMPGRTAQIAYQGEHIGYCGEIHPKVLNNFGLENPAIGIEFNVDRLLK